MTGAATPCDRVAERVEALRRAFEAVADAKAAAPMAAYMKGVAPFLGIPAPARRAAQRSAWSQLPPPADGGEVVDLVDALWALPEREYRYAAQEFLTRHLALCGSEIWADVERWLLTDPWWDTVDELARHVVGRLVQRDRSLDAEIDRWSASGRLWLIRSSILHQLGWRSEMEIERIESLCLAHVDHSDFFVRKAQGWALRSYAHLGPDEAARVREFIGGSGAGLSGLTRREALRRVRH